MEIQAGAATKLPTPTGNPWVPTPDDPATLPLPVPVIIVSVEGAYTEQDRKLWAFLLHAVWDELEPGAIHEVSIADLKQMFRSHNSVWIWESVERLASTKVTWSYTAGDPRYGRNRKGAGNLLDAEIEDEDKATGLLRFAFPPFLVPILKDPRRFARLRTHFLIELSGKYAVTLYELLESAANKTHPMLKVHVRDLRRWLKVPEGKLNRWQDLRRRALEPAIEQINKNQTGAGFKVTMKPVKDGRSIAWVVFEVVKTKERMQTEAILRDRQVQLSLFDIHLRMETYEKAGKILGGWDKYAVEEEWREKYGGQALPKNPDEAFLGFCREWTKQRG